jgi:hypothetical protein
MCFQRGNAPGPLKLLGALEAISPDAHEPALLHPTRAEVLEDHREIAAVIGACSADELALGRLRIAVQLDHRPSHRRAGNILRLASRQHVDAIESPLHNAPGEVVAAARQHRDQRERACALRERRTDGADDREQDSRKHERHGAPHADARNRLQRRRPWHAARRMTHLGIVLWPQVDAVPIHRRSLFARCR